MIEHEPDYDVARVLAAHASGGALAELTAALSVPVEAITDAGEVLQRIRESRPDVVLLGLDMPGLDPVQVLRAVRRDATVDNTPVLLIAPRDRERIAIAALEAGADDYLVMPVAPSVLYERIRYAVAVAELIRRITAARTGLRDARSAAAEAEREIVTLRNQLAGARELEARKRDFLILAAHELRASLAAAREHIAAGSPTTGDAGADVPAGALRSLERMAHLVDEMLETALLDADAPHLKVNVADLRAIVGSVVDDLEALPERRARVTHTSDDRPLLVAVNAERIRGVVGNLVDNALRYAPEGSTVRVSTGFDRDRHRATVAVSDSGAGISEEDLPDLFSRFARGLARGGNGNTPRLGLFLAKELAQLHGGDLDVRSYPGELTTFTLSLPLAGPRPRTTVLGGEVDLE